MVSKYEHETKGEYMKNALDNSYTPPSALYSYPETWNNQISETLYQLSLNYRSLENENMKVLEGINEVVLPLALCSYYVVTM